MSLHSDILPAAYCDELMKLNSDVTPMEFPEVEEVINRSYRSDWRDTFTYIDPVPLGSASIAQVHRAGLHTGEEVVVKVERKGVYDTMARDIGLLKRAVRLLPPIGNIKDMIDMEMVLDEMWTIAQEEMNFLKEASNIEEFSRNNRDVRYVGVPRKYQEYSTTRVLVMEYIDGFAIDDREVMGRLTERDRRFMREAVKGIALNDISMLENAILKLGDFWGKPEEGKLYEDLRQLLKRYGKASFGSLDVAEFLQEIMEIMKENKIGLPHGVSMLARGLTHMEGVLVKISPDINMVQIAAAKVQESLFADFDWKREISRGGRRLYRTVDKTMEIPNLTVDIMQEYLRGQARINMDLRATREFSDLLRHLVRNLLMGFWVVALLISSSIVCTTDMRPQVLGIPLIGAVGYVLAFFIVVFYLARHFFRHNGK